MKDIVINIFTQSGYLEIKDVFRYYYENDLFIIEKIQTESQKSKIIVPINKIESVEILEIFKK